MVALVPECRVMVGFRVNLPQFTQIGGLIRRCVLSALIGGGKAHPDLGDHTIEASRAKELLGSQFLRCELAAVTSLKLTNSPSSPSGSVPLENDE